MSAILQPNRDRAATVARQLIQSLNLFPPIDPTSLARSYGILVIQQPEGGPSADAHLILDRKTRRWVIVTNDRCRNRRRQRFSIAHELGHYFLHTTRILIQGSEGVMDDPHLEAEANRFASELLMPEAAVRILMFFPLPELAFQVSESAWSARLGQLGFR